MKAPADDLWDASEKKAQGLTPTQKEQLTTLVENGPLQGSAFLSNTLRMELERLKLCTPVVVRGDASYFAATMEGFRQRAFLRGGMFHG